jgi:hypothetical protein
MACLCAPVAFGEIPALPYVLVVVSPMNPFKLRSPLLLRTAVSVPKGFGAMPAFSEDYITAKEDDVVAYLKALRHHG